MTNHAAALATVEFVGDVAVVTMDDGKANAIGPDMVAALHAAFDRAEAEGKALVYMGRPDRFCAGFDLAIMAGSDADAAATLFREGAMLCHRLLLHPQPVVVAATGHAIALGSILLMACDLRYGVEGPFKIGMNEVAIGMQVPRFAASLARERLSRRHLQVATSHARLYDPAGAIDAGFLDHLTTADAIRAEAIAAAQELATTLNPDALRRTRHTMRGQVAQELVDGLDLDVADIAARP